MNSNLSLAHDIVNTGKNIGSFHPQQLRFLSNDPTVASQYPELSKQAGDFLQTAPAYWWVQYPGWHSSAMGNNMSQFSGMSQTQLENQLVDPKTAPAAHFSMQGSPQTTWQMGSQVAPTGALGRQATATPAMDQIVASPTATGTVNPRTGTVPGTGIDTTGNEAKRIASHKAAVERQDTPATTVWDINDPYFASARPELGKIKDMMLGTVTPTVLNQIFDQVRYLKEKIATDGVNAIMTSNETQGEPSTIQAYWEKITNLHPQLKGLGIFPQLEQPVTLPTSSENLVDEDTPGALAQANRDFPLAEAELAGDDGLTDAINRLNTAIATGDRELASIRFNELITGYPNYRNTTPALIDDASLESYMTSTGMTFPLTAEESTAVTDDADETVVADFTLRNEAVRKLDEAIDAGNRDLAQTLFTNLITEFPDYAYAGRPQDPVTTHFTPGTLESYMVGAGKTFPTLADDTVVDDTAAVADDVVAEGMTDAIFNEQTAEVETLLSNLTEENMEANLAQAQDLWGPLQAYNPNIGDFDTYVNTWLAEPGAAPWYRVDQHLASVFGTGYDQLKKLEESARETVTGWYEGAKDLYDKYSNKVEFLAEWGKYVPGPQQPYLVALDIAFDAVDTGKALSEGQILTAIVEGIDLVGPISGLVKDGKLLLPEDLKNMGKEALTSLLYKYLQHEGLRQTVKGVETATGLRDPEGTTDMATTPGSAVTGTGTDYLPESMEDYGKKRREYYEQYQAQPLLAQSEQQRSAIGRIRGQMMAKQGLMGSPLAVGLGTQQEAQMRGLAMQEVGRGRAEMELQLAEQAFRQNQIDRLAKQQETAEIRSMVVSALQNPLVQGAMTAVTKKIFEEITGRDWMEPLDTIVGEDMGGPVIGTDKPLVEDRPDVAPDKPGVGIVAPPVGPDDVKIKPPPEKPTVEVVKPPPPKPEPPPGDTTVPGEVPGEGTTTDLSPPISGGIYEIEPGNPLYPQTWSSSLGRLYGVNGTPTVQDVLVALENIQHRSGGDTLSLADSVNALVTGFSLGDPAMRTEAVTGMISDLGNMTNTLGPSMSMEDVQGVVNKWLTGKEYGQRPPEDADQGDLVPVDAGVVEDYRTEALNLASEIMAHPDRGLSTSVITPTEIVSSDDLVHITNVANAVINGEESLDTLRDLIDTLQSQLNRLGSNVSPLDSDKPTAEENGALQSAPLTGSAIGEAQNLHKEIEGLVNNIGFNHPDSQTIVPGRSGTLKVFDLVYSGSVLTEVLEGKRDIQDLYEIRNTLSGQASKVGTGSVSRLDTATLGFESTSPEDTVAETAGQMLGGAELAVNPITANVGELAQRLEVLKGNRASNGITGTGKEKEMSKEERLKNISVMVRLAVDTNDKDLLFTAKSMHRILKNKYPNLVEWDIFFDQAGSPAMAALLAGETNQPQYNVRT